MVKERKVFLCKNSTYLQWYFKTMINQLVRESYSYECYIKYHSRSFFLPTGITTGRPVEVPGHHTDRKIRWSYQHKKLFIFTGP